jgi:hypothetical protein
MRCQSRVGYHNSQYPVIPTEPSHPGEIGAVKESRPPTAQFSIVLANSQTSLRKLPQTPFSGTTGRHLSISRLLVQVERPHWKSVNTSAFTGTDRSLLRSVLGPWSPVAKCEAPGAPISVEEHTSMAPRPRRQSQNPPLQKSSAVPALPRSSKPRLRYSPGLAPTTRLNALLNAASDS